MSRYHNLEECMAEAEAYLASTGLKGMKLTLVARHPTDRDKFVVKTDDELTLATRTLLRAMTKEAETKPRPKKRRPARRSRPVEQEPQYEPPVHDEERHYCDRCEQRCTRPGTCYDCVIRQREEDEREDNRNSR